MWTLPLVTLPNSSLSPTRPSAAQVPTSSHPNLPARTVTFLLRSRTLESIEIGFVTLPKNSEASASASRLRAFCSSRACCLTCARKSPTVQTKIPEFHR